MKIKGGVSLENLQSTLLVFALFFNVLSILGFIVGLFYGQAFNNLRIMLSIGVLFTIGAALIQLIK